MYLYVLISIGIIWEPGDGVNNSLTTATKTAQILRKHSHPVQSQKIPKYIQTIYIPNKYHKNISKNTTTTADCMPEETI